MENNHLLKDILKDIEGLLWHGPKGEAEECIGGPDSDRIPVSAAL